MADADADTAAEISIEDVQDRHPEWRITRAGNMTLGWYWTATPRAEAKPPTFDHGQLLRGLAIAVSHTDPAELDRRIAEQDRLRAEMAATGETPFDGQTYLQVRAVPGGQR